MSYWILKTEPSTYSYQNLESDKKAVWDGVSSPKGLRNIRSAKKGDLVFIYHTGDEKRIVGIAEIISDPYPDPKFDDERLYVFDIRPVKKVKNPVTLAQVKAIKKYSDFGLVREPRLSVISVPEEYWKDLIKMSE